MFYFAVKAESSCFSSKQQSFGIVLFHLLNNMNFHPRYRYYLYWLTTVWWVLLHRRVLQPLLSAVSRQPALHPINAMTFSIKPEGGDYEVETHSIRPLSIVLTGLAVSLECIATRPPIYK